MTPTVSVIIATYNYGRFLAGSVRSVLDQTFADLEVFVIDDGSDDDTEAVAATFTHDPRFHFQRTERQGASAARNVGVRQARGRFIAFLDADDLWLPTKLERQLALFAADPKLGVVYTRKFLMDEHGHDLPYTQPTLYRGDILEEVFLINCVGLSTAMVRTEVFNEVGLFDESLKLGMDYDLWLRVALHYTFDFVDEPLVRYRMGHASISGRQVDRVDNALKTMGRFLARGGRAKLGKRVIRKAWAETYCTAALVRAYHSRLAALPWFVRSLCKEPGRLKTWKELLSLPIPQGLRRQIRRLLGRPTDWVVPPKATEASSTP